MSEKELEEVSLNGEVLAGPEERKHGRRGTSEQVAFPSGWLRSFKNFFNSDLFVLRVVRDKDTRELYILISRPKKELDMGSKR